MLMLATFAATTALSIPFYLLGAWPIVGFFGLDVLAVYIAFRANFRSARACEHFRLTYFELTFARVSAAGARREWRFSPAWVRLERVDDEDYGPQRLTLVSRGQSWQIGTRRRPRPKGGIRRRSHARARRSPARPALFLNGRNRWLRVCANSPAASPCSASCWSTPSSRWRWRIRGRSTRRRSCVRTAIYIVLGLAWVLPMMPLIVWMERGRLTATLSRRPRFHSRNGAPVSSTSR